MKVECPGCKKILSEEDFGQCHSVYKCRRDHIFVCCKADCQRTFEKRCDKVAETVRKTQHKLNNDGHTSALRRLPPGEREKFKQHAEAETNGWLICPEEAKASERSVPFCSHVIFRSGGAASMEEQQDKELPTPSGGESRGDAVEGEQDLVGDDMLVEIRREEDPDENEVINLANLGTGAGKAKKTPKGRKEKKGQQLIIDWNITSPGGCPVSEEGTVPDNWAQAKSTIGAAATAAAPSVFVPPPMPWQARNTPGGLGAAQVWSTVASRNTNVDVADKAVMDALQPRHLSAAAAVGTAGAVGSRAPPDHAQRRRALMDTTGCSEAKASELLVAHGWDLERAADALFQQPSSSIAGTFAAAAAAAARSDTTAFAAQAQQQQQQAAQSTIPRQQSRQASQQQQPQQLQQLQQQQAQLQPLPQQQAQEQQEEQQQPRPQPQLQQQLPPECPRQPPPPPLPSGWQAVWSQEQEAYYFWHLPTNDTTWDLPAGAGGAVAQSRDVGSAAPCPELATATAAVEAGVAGEQAALRTEGAVVEVAEANGHGYEGAHEKNGVPLLGHAVCTEHWRPREDLSACMRLFHGERVEVTWTDGQEGGWAYGAALEGPCAHGYFPQAVVRVARRAPCPRKTGELCSVAERFNAPGEVSGYVSVAPGDAVRVLHPSKDPFAWVWVERSSSRTPPEVGWAPECVLVSEGDAPGHAAAQQGRGGGPQAAG